MICIAVLLVASVIADYCKRPLATLVLLFAAFWFTGVYIQAFMIQHFDSYRHSAEFGKRASDNVPDNEIFYVANISDHHVTYYLRWPLVRMDDLEMLSEAISENAEEDNDYYVVTDSASVGKLKTLGRINILDRADELRHSETEDQRLVFLRLKPTQETQTLDQ